MNNPLYENTTTSGGFNADSNIKISFDSTYVFKRFDLI